ncbi:hypothetical protein D210916BOD24_07970 [Alteromonas sp. D210916BOD_24]|uniref:hypothetical protein n=1 Tax=Alteromonas sp. D210916BOD_24 TaxID=3157618 RepID=UPI00399CAB88
MRPKFYLFAGIVLMTVGLGFLGINIYGLFKDVRPPVFFQDELRFENDITLTREETFAAVNRQEGESDKAYAERITQVIGSGLAHIHWRRYDNQKFNQLVPIWENYFLYFMGKFSGIPEFERYHFANYERSLNRGIGICGDASMIMSQLLDKEGIPNQLLTFPGHVILTATFENGEELTFDPDFGVALNYSPADLQSTPNVAGEAYANAGYPQSDVVVMNRIYDNQFKRWDGVSHFITKKYYFEIVAYWLKWPVPIILLFLAGYLLRKSSIKRRVSHSQNE